MKNELYKLSAVDLLNMYKNKETNPLEVSLDIIKQLENKWKMSWEIDDQYLYMIHNFSRFEGYISLSFMDQELSNDFLVILPTENNTFKI